MDHDLDKAISDLLRDPVEGPKRLREVLRGKPENQGAYQSVLDEVESSPDDEDAIECIDLHDYLILAILYAHRKRHPLFPDAIAEIIGSFNKVVNKDPKFGATTRSIREPLNRLKKRGFIEYHTTERKGLVITALGIKEKEKHPWPFKTPESVLFMLIIEFYIRTRDQRHST